MQITQYRPSKISVDHLDNLAGIVTTPTTSKLETIIAMVKLVVYGIYLLARIRLINHEIQIKDQANHNTELNNSSSETEVDLDL